MNSHLSPHPIPTTIENSCRHRQAERTDLITLNQKVTSHGFTASDPYYNEGKIFATKSQAIFRSHAAFVKYNVLTYNLPTNFLHDLIYLHFIYVCLLFAGFCSVKYVKPFCSHWSSWYKQT